VERTTRQGTPDFVPQAERIAVFDNDGTLWAEQPMYFQLAFALDRIRALAPQHAEWKTTQPFKTFVSGGGVEFMRPWVERVYGVPPEQVVGSRVKVTYEVRESGPVLLRLPEIDFIDDKAGKPVGIHQAIGRRPTIAFGNSTATSKCSSGRPARRGRASASSFITPTPNASGRTTAIPTSGNSCAVWTKPRSADG
jgi:hypothetical protein